MTSKKTGQKKTEKKTEKKTVAEKYTVQENKYNGFPVLEIWGRDKTRPVVAFGRRKAIAIIANVERVKAFAASID